MPFTWNFEFLQVLLTIRITPNSKFYKSKIGMLLIKDIPVNFTMNLECLMLKSQRQKNMEMIFNTKIS